jgi:hypothetical protein
MPAFRASIAPSHGRSCTSGATDRPMRSASRATSTASSGQSQKMLHAFGITVTRRIPPVGVSAHFLESGPLRELSCVLRQVDPKHRISSSFAVTRA